MNYSLTTKHIEVSDQEKQMIEEKLGRLKKYLEPPFSFDIVLQGDTHHRHGNVVSCRIKLVQAGKTHHVDRARETIQIALDDCIEALSKEVRRRKDRKKNKRFSLGGFFKK